MKILQKNKKAYFDYTIEKKYEAGIVLKGWEAKSLKNGAGNLEGSFVVIFNGEAFLRNFRIKPWRYSPDKPDEIKERQRKLLLNKREILHIEQQRKQSRYTVVPLELIQNNRGYVKVVIGLAKSKKKFDKRRQKKEKDLKRRIKEDIR